MADETTYEPTEAPEPTESAFAEFAVDPALARVRAAEVLDAALDENPKEITAMVSLANAWLRLANDLG